MTTRHKYTNKNGERVKKCIYCNRLCNSKSKYGRTPNNCIPRIKPLTKNEEISLLKKDIILAKEIIKTLQAQIGKTTYGGS